MVNPYNLLIDHTSAVILHIEGTYVDVYVESYEHPCAERYQWSSQDPFLSFGEAECHLSNEAVRQRVCIVPAAQSLIEVVELH